MDVLFLFQTFSFQNSTIYLDLLRAVRDAGHHVTVIAGTSDDDCSDEIQLIEGMDVVFLKLEDQFGAGRIRKGLIQLSIGPRMKALIKKRIWDRKFDMTVYPTPPVTLAGAADMCRRHYKCLTYLMLKDIFPQNAVDLHMMKEGGLLHRYFSRMEKRLYAVSDRIGCMSQANIDYMKLNSPGSSGKLELFPNTVQLKECSSWNENQTDRVRFVFGGNMGAPQAIDFLLEGIRKCASVPECCMAEFSFVGSGSETGKLERYISENRPQNLIYMRSMPRDSYERLMEDADVGLVSLSSSFTIPNFPSRVLSYMQVGKPILAVTDRVTDIGRMIADDAKCGWWCPSDDPDAFAAAVAGICSERSCFGEYGRNGRKYLEEHFDVKISVRILENAIKDHGGSL